MKVKALVTRSCPTVCDPMNHSLPESSVMELSRQESWIQLPFLYPGDHPNSGIEPGSPALQAVSLQSEPSREVLRFPYWD